MFSRKRQQRVARQESEIQSIRGQTLDSIEKASRSSDKVIDFMDDKGQADIAKMLFEATGGRIRNGR